MICVKLSMTNPYVDSNLCRKYAPDGMHCFRLCKGKDTPLGEGKNDRLQKEH